MRALIGFLASLWPGKKKQAQILAIDNHDKAAGVYNSLAELTELLEVMIASLPEQTCFNAKKQVVLLSRGLEGLMLSSETAQRDFEAYREQPSHDPRDRATGEHYAQLAEIYADHRRMFESLHKQVVAWTLAVSARYLPRLNADLDSACTKIRSCMSSNGWNLDTLWRDTASPLIWGISHLMSKPKLTHDDLGELRKIQRSVSNLHETADELIEEQKLARSGLRTVKSRLATLHALRQRARSSLNELKQTYLEVCWNDLPTPLEDAPWLRRELDEGAKKLQLWVDNKNWVAARELAGLMTSQLDPLIAAYRAILQREKDLEKARKATYGQLFKMGRISSSLAKSYTLCQAALCSDAAKQVNQAMTKCRKWLENSSATPSPASQQAQLAIFQAIIDALEKALDKPDTSDQEVFASLPPLTAVEGFKGVFSGASS